MVGVSARRLALVVILLVAWLPTDAAAQAASAPASSQCSRAWPGHETEIEAALTSGAVSKLEAVPIGVTKPQRGYLPDGGPARRFAWKALAPQRRSGYMESYKAEIAAYHLDRLLDLGMVPPAVERTLEGRLGAAILWIEGTTGWNKDKPPRGPEPGWSKQISRMKLFDQLIANIDRNQGNLLYDTDWHLFLIDHSRAFTTRTSLSGIATIGLVDRALWTKIDTLTAEDLERALGAWLSADERRAMLTRRDRMREAIGKLVKAKGETGVFLE